MKAKGVRILIVSDDARTVAEISALFLSNMNADLTVVDTLEEASVATASGAYDLILASEKLADGDSLSLLDGQDNVMRDPFVLLTDSANAAGALEAMRRGAAEVFHRPFDSTNILSVVRRLIGRRREQKTQATRTQRLRRLSSRLIRDRRELRQRVDLICRDVVHAYRRLVDKTVQAKQDHYSPATDDDGGEFQAEL